MNTIERLQNWYISMCNGEWEHGNGVHVETLDNPGWHVKIDLKDTDLEDRYFPVIEYGVGDDSDPDDNNWIECKVENNVIHGHGGPEKLEEIFKHFLEWDEKFSEQRHSL